MSWVTDWYGTQVKNVPTLRPIVWAGPVISEDLSSLKDGFSVLRGINLKGLHQVFAVTGWQGK